MSWRLTDTGILPPDVHMSEGVENIFGLLKACGKHEEHRALLKEYDSGNRRYSYLKEVTANALVELTARFRIRRAQLIKDQ